MSRHSSRNVVVEQAGEQAGYSRAVRGGGGGRRAGRVAGRG